MNALRHGRMPDCGLYAITDRTLLPDITRLTSAVRAAICGGACMIQYRDKGVDHERRRVEADALVRICESAEVPFIVNDDIELAYAVGAAGVHLGRDDPDLGEARKRLGKEAIIGVSCYDDLGRARQAAAGGASYVVFGSVFPSQTKPAATHAPLELLTAARAAVDVPLGAIGGITPEHAGKLIAAGADFLAVIRAVFGTNDIEAAARAFAVQFPRRPDMQRQAIEE